MINLKIFICCIPCMLFTGCFSVTEQSADTDTTDTFSTMATFPSCETTSATTESSIYEQLYEEVSQYHETITFDRYIDMDEMADAVNELERRHPEIFWINGYSMRYDDTYAEITFKILNNYSPSDLRQMSDDLQQAALEITRSIPSDASDYDKILEVHDYLVQHCEYAQYAVSMDKGLWSTAYGCLINGEAVCQGYAQAFQMVMHMLGIESGICSGDAKGEAHAWNYVVCNQQYYWVDVTWDDPVENNNPDWVHHSYFMINDEMLYRTRTLDGKELVKPVCDSLTDNYFVREGNYLESYSFDEINKRLTAHQADGQIEIMFASQEVYQEAIKDLFDNKTIWNAEIFQSTGGSLNYQSDSDMHILRINFSVN